MRGFVEQVRAQDRDGRRLLELAQLPRGEPGFALANIQRVIFHRRERAQHVAVLDEVEVLTPAGGVPHIHPHRHRLGFRAEHGFEPGQSPELASKAAARLQPSIGVTSEKDGQIERGAMRRTATTAARQEQAGKGQEAGQQAAMCPLHTQRKVRFSRPHNG